MVSVFAGSMVHVLNYGDVVSYGFNMNMVLFLVLVQHLIHQLWDGISLIATLLSGIVEVIFQWYIISAMGEGPTTLANVAVLSLALSHWLMAPLFILLGTPHQKGEHEVLVAEEKEEELRAESDPQARSARNVIGAAKSGEALRHRRKRRQELVAAMHESESGSRPSNRPTMATAHENTASGNPPTSLPKIDSNELTVGFGKGDAALERTPGTMFTAV
jgi:hypothetical protein